MSRLLQAHIALFLVALIYGANYTIAKDVMGKGYLDPLPFILLRVSCGAILFWIFHKLLIRETVEKKDLLRLAICGLFGVALNQMLFFLGLNQTTPINASLIMTTTPILVLIASAIYLGERITPVKIAGIFLGALGAGLLIAYGERLNFGEGWKGDLLVFLNAFCFGVYLVMVKKLMRRYHPITVVKWVFLFGLCFVIPFSIQGAWDTDWQSFTPGIWLAVAYVLIFTTFLSYLFNNFALSVVNPSVVSIYIYLQPFLATLIALLAGSDQLSTIKILAATLIFTGVYLVSFGGNSVRKLKLKNNK